MKILCWWFYIETPFDLWYAARETSEIFVYKYSEKRIFFRKAYFLRNLETSTGEVLQLRMQSFQVIAFIWTQTLLKDFQICSSIPLNRLNFIRSAEAAICISSNLREIYE